MGAFDILMMKGQEVLTQGNCGALAQSQPTTTAPDQVRTQLLGARL